MNAPGLKWIGGVNPAQGTLAPAPESCLRPPGVAVQEGRDRWQARAPRQPPGGPHHPASIPSAEQKGGPCFTDSTRSLLTVRGERGQWRPLKSRPLYGCHYCRPGPPALAFRWPPSHALEGRGRGGAPASRGRQWQVWCPDRCFADAMQMPAGLSAESLPRARLALTRKHFLRHTLEVW